MTSSRLDFVSREEGLAEMDGFANRTKTFLKEVPYLYNFLQAWLTPAFSPMLRGQLTFSWVRRYLKQNEFFRGNSLILNIGSGTKRILPQARNLDIYPFPNVDIVASVYDIPFKEGSADFIVCDSVLEHLREPEKAIHEMVRTLRSGGYLYLTVPFVYPFHASPNDFTRWTVSGLRNLFLNEEIVKIGMRGGPAGALQGVLAHMMAMLLSFSFDPLYHLFSHFFLLIFSPIKLLDLIFSLSPQAPDIAAHLCILVRKR